MSRLYFRDDDDPDEDKDVSEADEQVEESAVEGVYQDPTQAE